MWKSSITSFGFNQVFFSLVLVELSVFYDIILAVEVLLMLSWFKHSALHMYFDGFNIIVVVILPFGFVPYF